MSKVRSDYFTYTISRSRIPGATGAVGITFKPTPSLSHAELGKLIIDLKKVQDAMDHPEDKKWIWDNAGYEIAEGPAQNKQGWEYTKTYPNGVREYKADRGYVALECEASSKEDAHNKFAHYCEEYVEATR